MNSNFKFNSPDPGDGKKDDKPKKNDGAKEKQRELTFDRDHGRDYSLSEGRYEREFNKMLDNMRDMEKELNIDADNSTGGRNSGKSNYHGQFDLSEGPVISNDWKTITDFGAQKGFQMSFAITGKHSPNSQHYKGKAADFSVKNTTVEQQNKFVKDARAKGLYVNDERRYPSPQEIKKTGWSGPHIHIDNRFNVPGEKIIDSSVKTPDLKSSNTNLILP